MRDLIQCEYSVKRADCLYTGISSGPQVWENVTVQDLLCKSLEYSSNSYGCFELSMCMLNHWLEWYKWVLTNFDHDRQWFNTLIPPSHETAAVTFDCVDCISRLRGLLRLVLRYTTVDIHCRDRRYEWDGGISQWVSQFNAFGVSIYRYAGVYCTRLYFDSLHS